MEFPIWIMWDEPQIRVIILESCGHIIMLDTHIMFKIKFSLPTKERNHITVQCVVEFLSYLLGCYVQIYIQTF